MFCKLPLSSLRCQINTDFFQQMYQPSS